jgi:farnesyl-diphosphate farnesyltransferase
MVVDIMKHIPDVLDYLNLVKEPTIFKFCAIPQVMAIATLERCYNNPKVFSTEVKIRKGEAVKVSEKDHRI